MVKAGDALVQIDPRPYQAALDQAVAKKAQDEATLKNAELDLQRYAGLAKEDSVSRQNTTRNRRRSTNSSRNQRRPSVYRQRPDASRLHPDPICRSRGRRDFALLTSAILSMPLTRRAL